MRENDFNNLSRTDISLLLDFYGQLLTSHTRDVLDLHFGEDMTLSEIAAHLGITRQAVHDRIRQGVGSLSDYENKLGLIERFRVQKECIGQAIQSIENGAAQDARETLVRLTGLL